MNAVGREDRFAFERRVRRKHPDRHLALDLRVAGPVDFAHPSGPKRIEKLEAEQRPVVIREDLR